MRYLLLIYEDESTRPTEMTPEAMQPWMEFGQEVESRGVMRGGEALLPTATATTVRLARGNAVTTDGPFAETKEQLGGFYMLDCKDLDEALEFAAKIPSLVDGGSVEVRPIMEIENAG
jgi:hypothetical protein